MIYNYCLKYAVISGNGILCVVWKISSFNRPDNKSSTGLVNKKIYGNIK